MHTRDFSRSPTEKNPVEIRQRTAAAKTSFHCSWSIVLENHYAASSRPMKGKGDGTPTCWSQISGRSFGHSEQSCRSHREYFLHVLLSLEAVFKKVRSYYFAPKYATSHIYAPPTLLVVLLQPLWIFLEPVEDVGYLRFCSWRMELLQSILTLCRISFSSLILIKVPLLSPSISKFVLLSPWWRLTWYRQYHVCLEHSGLFPYYVQNPGRSVRYRLLGINLHM